MDATYAMDDYELRWPPQLFVEEVNRLRDRSDRAVTPIGDPTRAVVATFDIREWYADIEWLLADAFRSTVPVDEFKSLPREDVMGRPHPTAEEWLTRLVHEVARWSEPSTRKPYWSARTAAKIGQPLGVDDVAMSFFEVIADFEANGYLIQAFGHDCVDNVRGRKPDPSVILSRLLGYRVIWPPHFVLGNEVSLSPDFFYDLVEVFHDLVARPSSRWYHDYQRCGWHYSRFSTGSARRLYRWRVNRLLAGSDLGLRLADSGEDVGRLVRTEPTGLEELPEKALQAATPETVDRLRHAIALFRSRQATVEERRSAVIALAGLLEERRALIDAEFLKEDEGALFEIANKFAIRHQGANQRGDYDRAYLDWVFWWFLGTLELTNRLFVMKRGGHLRRLAVG